MRNRLEKAKSWTRYLSFCMRMIGIRCKFIPFFAGHGAFGHGFSFSYFWDASRRLLGGIFRSAQMSIFLYTLQNSFSVPISFIFFFFYFIVIFILLFVLVVFSEDSWRNKTAKLSCERQRYTWRCLNGGDAHCPEKSRTVLKCQVGCKSLESLDDVHVPCEDHAGSWLMVLACENERLAATWL